MKWRWGRTEEEKARDRRETDTARRRVERELDRLERTLSEARAQIMKEIPNGGTG